MQVATVIVYLSDVEAGGETVFLLEGKDGLVRLQTIDYKKCDTGIAVSAWTFVCGVCGGGDRGVWGGGRCDICGGMCGVGDEAEAVCVCRGTRGNSLLVS